MSGWIDAHLHLDAPAFDPDRDAVVARAIQAGVGLMVSAGTSVESSHRSIALAERYPSVVAAVGIHPEAAETATAGTVEALAAMAQHPRVVAIGEIGLDYYRNTVPRNVQIEVFRSLIRLAREIDLPVIVHDREAHEDVERILVEEGGSRVVLHCFAGTPERALRCAATGWMLSLAGPLTFPKSAELREVAKAVPLDRILLETDAPYLAPQPARGRRCEPAFLAHTARTLADLRQVHETALAAALAQNARRVFALPDEE
ncbi:MAG TPA: TatD family hydrolase [bacterium]|nr:TatD family hydrolase [bacterium]